MLLALASDCLIARWNNLQSHKTNALVWHVLLYKVGARLDYRILGRGEKVHAKGDVTPNQRDANHLKEQCEPIVDENLHVNFAERVIRWEVQGDQISILNTATSLFLQIHNMQRDTRTHIPITKEELASFAGKLNECLRYLKGKYTLFCAEQVKASEPSAETDQEGVYSTPLVDWHIPQEQVLKLRGVLSRTQAFWQTYHPVLETLTTVPFVAESSAACFEETKRRIKELNPKLPEHARLLPFYKCISAQFPDNVILEPLSAPSVFNPEVKVTAFRWGLTMILQIRKECIVPFQVLVVEGINDGFLNSIRPGHLQGTSFKFHITYQFGGFAFGRPYARIGFEFPTTYEWQSRTKVHLVPTDKAQNMLRSVLWQKMFPPDYDFRGSNAIFSFGHNQTTWILAMLQIAGASLDEELGFWSFLHTSPFDCTHKKSYWDTHPQSEKL
ncbi:MAG: hypothetical protein LLG04_17775 [Parachlamydia sp.]|nr:hypothetical protein [Parachlamydia sp.]